VKKLSSSKVLRLSRTGVLARNAIETGRHHRVSARPRKQAELAVGQILHEPKQVVGMSTGHIREREADKKSSMGQRSQAGPEG
jgi:hypothetical protein